MPDIREASLALHKRLQDISVAKGAIAGVIVPVAVDAKKPIPRHRRNQWTDAHVRDFFRPSQPHAYRLGILLLNLFVLDFDKMAVYKEWSALFPELLEAPAERTKNGVHVYMWRSEAVEKAKLTDGPLIDPVTGEKKFVDRKTRTRVFEGGAFTKSLIVCAPTPNYEWLGGRSLMDIDPPDPSPELLAAIVHNTPTVDRDAKKAPRVKKDQPPAAEPAAAGAPAAPKEEPAPVVYELGGAGARRADGTISVAIDTGADLADVRTMFPAGTMSSQTCAFTREGYDGLSFKFTGLCALCRKVSCLLLLCPLSTPGQGGLRPPLRPPDP